MLNFGFVFVRLVFCSLFQFFFSWIFRDWVMCVLLVLLAYSADEFMGEYLLMLVVV